MFPLFGIFEKVHLGPQPDFFAKLNSIQYMWMPHIDRLYSPLDSPESSLMDLYGSSTLAGSSIASVVNGVARACVDNDSVEANSLSVQIDSYGTVTSIHLGPESTINSISQVFSSYPGCQPVLFKNHFFLSMGESSVASMTASSAHGLGFSTACTE
jgi:hypothetical protein